MDEYGNPSNADKASAEAKLQQLKAEGEAKKAEEESSNIDSISYTIKTKDGRKATMNLKLSDKESLRKIKKVLESADKTEPQQPKAKSEGKEW